MLLSSASNAALAKTDLTLENIHYLVGTGRGRTQVPFARETISEIACGAAGAVHIWGPSVRTVLDAGGQSCKVIHCTEKGRATAFLWNDKCAAGIGRSMETFADLVQKEVTEIGNIALQSDQFPKLSDFCAVYAQSEALDFIRSKVPLEQVIAAYHYAMAKRISTLVARSGLKKDFVIIGGLARNPGIMDWLERILKVSRLAPKPEWDPGLTTALGAALFADSFYRRQQSTDTCCRMSKKIIRREAIIQAAIERLQQERLQDCKYLRNRSKGRCRRRYHLSVFQE